MKPLSRFDIIDHMSSVITEGGDGVEGDTAIFAGHQVVRTDHEYMDLGIFPEATMNIAWSIVERVREQCQDIRIFSLINDWQCARGTGNTPDAMADAYWSNPDMALTEIRDADKRKFLLPGMPRGTVAYDDNIHLGRISESRLQNQFGHRMRKDGGFRESILKAIEDAGTGGNASAYCRVDSCTSEYLQLIPELFQQRIRRLISFIPSTCRGFISSASRILETHDLLERDSSDDDPFALHNFYLPSGFGGSRKPSSDAELFSVADGAGYERFVV